MSTRSDTCVHASAFRVGGAAARMRPRRRRRCYGPLVTRLGALLLLSICTFADKISDLEAPGGIDFLCLTTDLVKNDVFDRCDIYEIDMF